MAWQCARTLRSVYHAPTLAEGLRRARKVLDSFPSCPIPEVARLGRTLRSWQPEWRAYFSTGGVSNGPVEATNLNIETSRKIAHGFRNFRNYRLPADSMS